MEDDLIIEIFGTIADAVNDAKKDTGKGEDKD